MNHYYKLVYVSSSPYPRPQYPPAQVLAYAPSRYSPRSSSPRPTRYMLPGLVGYQALEYASCGIS